MKIILASGSPRRRELLSQIGLDFEVIVSNADENVGGMEPAKMVEELAYRKASAVWFEHQERIGEKYARQGESVIIIGADTIVVNDGKVLGKPTDEDNAKQMLRSLSGKTHDVYTGVAALIVGSTGTDLQVKIFSERTGVHFNDMTDKEIDEYVATKDPHDKAGAYGIQGFCARYISGIEGDYNNVVGLPVARLYNELKEYIK